VSDLRSAISTGHYARKQLFSNDKLVAWSHARRFSTGIALAREFRGKRVLDFGSGDGTFLALAMMNDAAPAAATGAEITREVVEDCRRRYRGEPRLTFVQVGELDARDQAGAYDAVFCMEVLEHVVDWEPELARMARLLAPGGKLIVSVPVETGMPVLVKQTVRRIAGWRGVGHYPGTSAYSWPELLSSVFAGERQHVVRPVFDTGSGPSHDHKGFNWMVLRERLRRQFVLERVVASPFSWLGPGLATQVWFVCGARP
jgi:SAM-dependent methyltransferase